MTKYREILRLAALIFTSKEDPPLYTLLQSTSVSPIIIMPYST